MNLVTVTYSNDELEMVRQAKSINKFVKDVTHWVIINDDTDIDYWHELLSSHYTKNSLRLIKFDSTEWFYGKIKQLFKKRNKHLRGDGYKLQQVYKLLIYKHINDDYIVLDSKDFFIRSCNSTDFSYLRCSEQTRDLFESVNNQQTNIAYSKRLGIVAPKFIIQANTPFKIKKNIMDTIQNLDEMLFWFNNVDVDQSEFILYSLIEHKNGAIDLNSPMSKPMVDSVMYYSFIDTVKFDEDCTNNFVKIISVHSNFWKTADLTTKENYNKMLDRLDIL